MNVDAAQTCDVRRAERSAHSPNGRGTSVTTARRRPTHTRSLNPQWSRRYTTAQRARRRRLAGVGTIGVAMGKPKKAPGITAVKTLFGASRNQCYFERCEEHLTDPSWKTVKGQIAHIKGERPRAARYDAMQSPEDRHHFDNLMLLCPNHHTLIDSLDPDSYSVERLKEMKRRHLEHEAAKDWANNEALTFYARQAIDHWHRQSLADTLELAPDESPPIAPQAIRRRNVASESAIAHRQRRGRVITPPPIVDQSD
jgi:hypothetical protein